ncbi:DENN domain-containing protein 5B [Morella rubra]|uniref:DENN domain-containing protein 5B n=1 Tax=Morella rubra TaxID=262757 RepID=A0A6A1V9V1_9ROSI|nr:DENN domain-containing protein 5B [Morella rubra]
MDTKEDAEVQEQPSSPILVLQHISGALHSMYSGNSNVPPPGLGQGHRRSQSEVVTTAHGRHNSFQRLKSHMQKAWKWGSNSRVEDYQRSFNPEVLANQKRQWYQFHTKSPEHIKFKEPTSLFEHFIIVGIHPDANLEVVEEAFAKRKKWEFEMEKSEILDSKMLQYRGASNPTLEPQILFKYPPGKRLMMRPKDLAAFCFPGGVKARLIERTPSLSELNELVYGQEHLNRDDLAFIFSLKVANNATLYGVCLHVPEIVQRPPGILGISSPLSRPSGGYRRFLVSAPRCYCVLTRVPFFELHYEMLNSIIAHDRLNRITKFVSELTLTDYVPSATKSHDQMNGNVDSPAREHPSDLMASAIPVDSALALTAAAAGFIPDDEIPSSLLKIWEPQSPESVTVVRLRILANPARSVASEDDDDEAFANWDKDFRDDIIMEWAKENKNDLLQIVCGYHALPLPELGSELVFQPLEHLQAIEYRRPPVAALGLHAKYIDSLEEAEVNAKLAAAEEALALSVWTTATICRVLSLESVLALVAGVLLEKQVVVVCPNLGVLSAIVLSLIPMIRPFQWQSLLLPVLPGRMLDFLDAPVPYIVGIQHKPTDLKMKPSNLVHVNVLKDQVKIYNLPTLPRHKELVSELGPIHARLSHESSIAKRHPVYRCNEVQVSLLLKDSFIDSFSSRDRPFIKVSSVSSAASSLHVS